MGDRWNFHEAGGRQLSLKLEAEMSFETLLGDEAIALGALHAGLSCAFAYPGTPSTEIMDSLIDWKKAKAAPGMDTAAVEAYTAQWCTNEKTAYESALGVSFAGKRTMVSMKHVGLNVAGDPFMNSAILKINGGLVVVVADDPSMHSSQDEQDSRVFADFARIPCFEPADQQEAYDLARRAFDYSEKWQVPVLIRMVTRLAHSRASVKIEAPKAQNQLHKTQDTKSWIVMPAIAKKLWKNHLEKQTQLRGEAEKASTLTLGEKELGVITSGIALTYFNENLADAEKLYGGKISHLHINSYPIPTDRIKELSSHVKKLLVIEEGYPYIEDKIRGVFETPLPVIGKRSGEIPLDGELSPDSVRRALGLKVREGISQSELVAPNRPPQLCPGCPHRDSFAFLMEAIKDYPIDTRSIHGDIGCYTLGVMPPYNAIESCVCMGASAGMARGASVAGLGPTVGVIGDSTFYHSGITNLIDAVAHHTNFTLIIMDNDTTAMTGAQPTILPSERLRRIAVAIGVEENHVICLTAHKNNHEENVAATKRELAYNGVSVIISSRECLEALKKARKA